MMIVSRLTLCSVYVVVVCSTVISAISVRGQSRSLLRELPRTPEHPTVHTWSSPQGQPLHEIEQQLVRMRRQAGNAPVIHGEHNFNDGNNYATIYYVGNSSPVIIVLTYQFSQISGFLGSSNLYRSTNYGASFTPIEAELDDVDNNPSLWMRFDVSPNNMIILYNANLPKFYFSTDEGQTWTKRSITPATINPRSLLWNSVNERMALAHDGQGDQLYVTQDLGATWTKIADYVAFSTDYQWGDPSVDADASVLYFNSYDPNDVNRNNFTVSLQTQRVPFTSSTLREFDPNLGRHDDFLLLGRYIFAQKTEQGNIHLYISYNRQPFQQAMIPSTDAHQNYIVSHIDQQQALVIVNHASGRFNLYLSDITGQYFSLSLPDIVTSRSGVDLEVIEGVNGTLVANQNVRTTGSDNRPRTLISLDNGGNWELVRSPDSANCVPPQCSLHFHMTTSEYARTGVYSQASSPGLILAHGNTGSTLSDNPDLYISRDGGVSWSLTLTGSWGVTVVDHGGLLVAARDYHHTPSTELRYSCNEGISWSSFTFVTTGMTVYGVLTEPGEHTTTVSMYGLKVGTSTWNVVTVNFSSIFPSTCPPSAYYYWQPWDDRTDESCILGSSVTIERRNASICCLIGQDYSRPVQFSICTCNDDDFECDYGYMRSDGFTGPCVRDSSVSLPPNVCSQGQLSYPETQGYRKVAGDVCVGGVENTLGSILHPCCNVTTDPDPCQSRCVAGVSTCQLTPSGYACQCVAGYAGSPCTDVNECSSSTSPCDDMATCRNTQGSFRCTCNAGYVGDGLHCYNINECLEQSPCAEHATCTDTMGSFTCTCDPGYSGDGLASGSGCNNVNECVLSPPPCDSSAHCVDTIGSFQCTCNDGFSGNGFYCYNCVSPCATLSCASGARCVYGDRGYRCECDAGRIGDGLTSGSGCHVPANGCNSSSPCSANAMCSVVSDNYVCQCKAGYNGDGFKNGSGCLNIDECSVQPAPCIKNATCFNSDGSFFCRCPAGYLGDGLVNGSGCTAAQVQGSTSGTVNPVGLIVLGVLLVLALGCVLILVVVVIKKQCDLNKRGATNASIRYRTAPAEEEQPLTWKDDDDDDEPLLT